MQQVNFLHKINKRSVARVGGKGASLGELLRAGIAVPPGFVILASAFDRFLHEACLRAEIDSLLHTIDREKIHSIEAAAEKIAALIERAPLPLQIADDIQKSFNNLNTRFVAVRSSATAEDCKSATWAGQLATFLNITEDKLFESVKKCWASLFSPRAIFYRHAQKFDAHKISVAVVVQKMVDAEISGVGFSVHPITQDYNQLIIEAGFGLGEAIVSGHVTPDSYVVEKAPLQIIDKNIAEQTRGLYRSKKGGNEWRAIPHRQGKKQVLPDTDIIKLSNCILKIEKHYGFPVDIEWAMERGKLFVLQSRPITTLEK